MTRRIQDGTQRSLQAMDQGCAMANSNVEHIGELSGSLSFIDQCVSTIKDMSLQIASSAEEQAAVANEISCRIISINGVADTTSQGAAQTTEASRKLADLAEHLRKIASQFVIWFTKLFPYLQVI